MNKLRKFLQLNQSERWTLVMALALVPLMALILRMVGLRRCRRMLSFFISQDFLPKIEQSEKIIFQALRVNHLVGLAVRHGIYPANCLQRSLALWWLLHRQGIQSELRFGTRKAEGRFEAHAWVEVGGVVVNDSDDVRLRYSPFDRAIIRGAAEFL